MVDRASQAITRRGRFVAAIVAASLVTGVGLVAMASRPSIATANCVLARPPSATTQGAPERALLSILGVLRRAQKATDSLSLSIAGGYTEEVFVRYVRRLRVVDGTAYFLVPATFTTCEPAPAYQAVRFVAVHAGGGAAGTLARIPGIASGALAFSSGNGMTSAFAAVIPDGVASVTLHYAADPPASPDPLTLQADVINNCVVFANIPRNAAPNYSMVWHNAAGKVVAH